MTKKRKVLFEQTIQAPVSAVYEAFTNQAMLTQWLCNNAHVDAQEGGAFLLTWNQSKYYATGEFIRLKENKKIAFTWHGRGEPHETAVTVKLKKAKKRTKVTLKHKKLGSGEVWRYARKQIKDGWRSSLANLQQVLETGLDRRIYERPFLGITIAGLVGAEEAAELSLNTAGGMRINGTIPGTGAAEAGLQDQDILTKMNGNPLIDFHAIQQVLGSYKAGDTVSVEFFRKGQHYTSDMTLSQRPAPDVPATPAELAAQLREEYAAIAAELAALAADTTEDEASLKPNGGWSAKETLAHLLTTERTMHLGIASNMDGRILSDLPYNPSSWIKAYADAHTFASLTAAFSEAMDETIAILTNLPDDLVARKVMYLGIAQNALGYVSHVRGHFADMQQPIEAAREAAAKGAPDAVTAVEELEITKSSFAGVIGVEEEE